MYDNFKTAQEYFWNCKMKLVNITSSKLFPCCTLGPAAISLAFVEPILHHDCPIFVKSDPIHSFAAFLLVASHFECQRLTDSPTETFMR